MTEPIYRDRDWMHEHYIVLQESTTVMAQKAGCGCGTIWEWLCKFNIPTRTRRESTLLFSAREFQPYRDRDWLYRHYIILQEPSTLMAQKADCSHVAILKWLRKFNIPIRTLSEAIFLAERNYLTISEELLDLIEGELLGDGYVGMNGLRSAQYQHTSKYRDYLIWLSKKFSDLGLEQVGKIDRYDGVLKGKPYTTYRYTSRSYPELVPLRERWYPGGKKIVPKDLVLTPIMARQFYLGDGGLSKQKGRRSQISFATCDFDKASIDHLLAELRDRGFKVSHWPASNSIGMLVESVKDFLNWIGPCPIDCYSYKWNYQDNRKRVQ